MFASYIRCGDDFDDVAAKAQESARQAHDRLAASLAELRSTPTQAPEET